MKMDDRELLSFAKFLLDRFAGIMPDDRMIVNALNDFRRDWESENGQ